jgi:hypothetical protein
MTKVTLEYRRVGTTLLSEGRIISDENGLLTEDGLPLVDASFRDLLKALARALETFEKDVPVEVYFQRTDREGLLPYKLDEATVKLLREDPVAAIQALEYPTHSPSSTIERVRKEREVQTIQPIAAGHTALADSFGDVVYFKVRAHELECPGCGFWGMYTTPGLLSDKDRAGEVMKTAFVCPKKCKTRFIVTCDRAWGYVDVKYLLEQTKLDAFYFPRAWNEGRPWVSRETLTKMFNEYEKSKESASCSEPTVSQ